MTGRADTDVARLRRKIANTYVARREYGPAAQEFALANAALGTKQRLDDASWRREWPSYRTRW